MRLSNSDLKRVLFSLNELASDHTPETLPERTFAAVKCLVAADVIAYEGFGNDNHYEGPLWYTPVESVNAGMIDRLGKFVSDHPCFDGIAAQHIKGSVRISDYVTLPEFKRTTIYNEFFRYLGTDRQIVAGLHVSQNLTVTCSLCRLRKDYTRRDCCMIDLLTPHLTTAFRQAQFVHRLKFENDVWQTSVTSAKLAVLPVDQRFQILAENPTAANLLSKYFKNICSTLPEELSDYIKYHRKIFTSDEFYLPPKPFEKLTTEGKLVIKAIFNTASRTVMLLLEEFPMVTAGTYASLGLTNREGEVLIRISDGKTDGEIAQILNISVRTVQKHIEHIFNKLGVETRTAAASITLR